jgi:hypothetical protein
MTKHELSYKFFPFLIDAFNRDKIPQSALLDKAYWAKFSEKETHEFSWEEVGMVHRKLSETELVVVLSFPEPVRVSDAKYGLMFFNNKRRDIEYYTLERAEPDTASSEKWTVGYVCVDDGLHKNRGPFDQEPTVDNVVSHVYINFVKRKGLFGRKR